MNKMAASPANYYGGFILDVVAGVALVAWGASACASVSHSIAATALGIGAYTLSEYALHRWAYHATKGLARAVHIVHHQSPRKLQGAPFFFTLSLAGLAWALASRIAGAEVGASFAGTILLGYWYQSLVHHWMHHGKILFTSGFSRLRRHHNLHHRNSGVNFGLVTRFWDRVLGTYSK